VPALSIRIEIRPSLQNSLGSLRALHPRLREFLLAAYSEPVLASSAWISSYRFALFLRFRPALSKRTHETPLFHGGGSVCPFSAWVLRASSSPLRVLFFFPLTKKPPGRPWSTSVFICKPRSGCFPRSEPGLSSPPPLPFTFLLKCTFLGLEFAPLQRTTRTLCSLQFCPESYCRRSFLFFLCSFPPLGWDIPSPSILMVFICPDLVIFYSCRPCLIPGIQLPSSDFSRDHEVSELS